MEGHEHDEHGAPERPPLPEDATLWQRFRYHARPSIALGIVLVSVMGAIMSYRASLDEEEGSKAANLSGQQEIQRESALSTDRALVDQDVRVFGRIQEHLLLSRQLLREARSATGADARELYIESQRELALARGEQSFLQAAGLDATHAKPRYDVRLARQQAVASDQDLERLAVDELTEEGEAAHSRVIKLVGLAALFVVSLFFLTLAEANAGAIRRGFVVLGGAVAIGAALASLTI
jgi:hypothetical protein